MSSEEICIYIIYGYFTSRYSIYYIDQQKVVSFQQYITPFAHPFATARYIRFQGNFRLILCRNPQFLHKNKKFCISDLLQKTNISHKSCEHSWFCLSNLLLFATEICMLLRCRGYCLHTIKCEFIKKWDVRIWFFESFSSMLKILVSFLDFICIY